MCIGIKQIDLINLSKKYIEKINSFNIDVAKSAFCWLFNLREVPGYFVLKNLQKNKKISIGEIYLVLKQFIGVSTLHNYKILSKITSEKSFEKLIISWATREDFDDNGSYYDRYFKQNSKDDRKNIWLLIYLDEKIPQKIDKNVIIFGKENSKKKYNFFYLIRVFINIILQHKGSIVKTFHFCSRSSHLAKIISSEVIEIVKAKSFKNILLAYEAQPFQNTIFKEIKKINNKIKLIGYLHSTQAFTPFYIYRDGAPDLLLSHSNSQIFHLKEYLNWPEKKLKLVPSLRYQQKDMTKFNNKLVLPISLSSEKILLKQFKKFLEKSEKNGLKPLTIKNHPFANKSKTHGKFINNLNKILFEYSDRFSIEAKNNVSIFFGGTSTILEALENDLTVIHICADLIFESYSEVFWPSIRVNKIDENIIRYDLKSSGECINFGLETNIFEKYYN